MPIDHNRTVVPTTTVYTQSTFTTFPVDPVITTTTRKTTTNRYVCSNIQIILKPFVYLNSKMLEITNASVILNKRLDKQKETLECSCGSICFNSNNCSYFTVFTNVQGQETNCILYRFLNFNKKIQTLIQQNSYLVQNYTVSSGFNNITTGVGVEEAITTEKPLNDLQ